jgi:hypothetical protein
VLNVLRRTGRVVCVRRGVGVLALATSVLVLQGQALAQVKPITAPKLPPNVPPKPLDEEPINVPYSSSTDEPIVTENLPADPQPQTLTVKDFKRKDRHARPFREVALQIKVGSAGAGFDIATPIAQHFNLRGGASFFSYETNLVEDGLKIDGAVSFDNAAFMLDYFPFHNGLRFSPGITFYNDTHLDANLFVPGGQAFSLSGNDATSDPDDPVHGAAHVKLGRMIAPRFTFGWGNMLPRKAGSHWSVPVEMGIQYIQRPTLRLSAQGSSCASQTEPDGTVDYGCGPIDQAELAKEAHDLQGDLSILRFFPILSVGVAYRFGK